MHSAQYRDVGGCRSFLERWSGDSGPVVVCIHTAGQSGAQYRDVAPALAARGFDVLVVDLPGHGRSEPVASGPVSDLSWYATWVVDVLRDLDVGEAYLIGCSIGGSIALDVATRADVRVAGVLALDPSGVLGADGPRPRPPLLEDSVSPSMRDRTYLGTLAACGRTVPRDRVEMIARMHCREDWHVTTLDIQGALTHDIRDALGAITCPVYLLTGSDDYFVPPERVRRIADLIPHARYEVLDGVGHYPIEELTDVADRFADWVDTLRVAP